MNIDIDFDILDLAPVFLGPDPSGRFSGRVRVVMGTSRFIV